MLTKAKITAKLEKLKADERLYYSSANVFSNAPLALIQTQLESQIHILEDILELPLSKFPLKK